MPGVEPSVAALTVFVAGMMACALLAILSPDGADVPARYYLDGFFGYGGSLPGTETPITSCICRTRTSRASVADLGLLPG